MNLFCELSLLLNKRRVCKNNSLKLKENLITKNYGITLIGGNYATSGGQKAFYIRGYLFVTSLKLQIDDLTVQTIWICICTFSYHCWQTCFILINIYFVFKINFYWNILIWLDLLHGDFIAHSSHNIVEIFCSNIVKFIMLNRHQLVSIYFGSITNFRAW